MTTDTDPIVIILIFLVYSFSTIKLQTNEIIKDILEHQGGTKNNGKSRNMNTYSKLCLSSLVL